MSKTKPIDAKPEVKAPETLCEFLEQRERVCWSYDVDTFTSKPKGGFGQIRIRVPMQEELHECMLKIRAYVKEYAKDSGLDTDPDFLANVKAVHFLNLACRQQDSDGPAFQGVRWMMQHLTADELSVLLNLYHQTLILASPMDLGLDDQKVESVATLCATYTKDKDLNEFVAQFSREVMAELLIRVSVKLSDARQEIEALRKGAEIVGKEPDGI